MCCRATHYVVRHVFEPPAATEDWIATISFVIAGALMLTGITLSIYLHTLQILKSRLSSLSHPPTNNSGSNLDHTFEDISRWKHTRGKHHR